MRNENERYLALAIHVQMASEAMVAAARSLAVLRPDAALAAESAAWTRTVDELQTMNAQLGCMRRILVRMTRTNRAAGPRTLTS